MHLHRELTVRRSQSNVGRSSDFIDDMGMAMQLAMEMPVATDSLFGLSIDAVGFVNRSSFARNLADCWSAVYMEARTLDLPQKQ
jgi:hypothetical protein